MCSVAEQVIQRLVQPIIGREQFNEPIPRRFWIDDPGEVNRANWTAAYTDQGFTPNVKDALSLSKERVWYDKKAPGFGAGN